MPIVPVLRSLFEQTEETGKGIGATAIPVIATRRGKGTDTTLTTATRTITMVTAVPIVTRTGAQGATATAAPRGRGPTTSTATTATTGGTGTTTTTGEQGETQVTGGMFAEVRWNSIYGYRTLNTEKPRLSYGYLDSESFVGLMNLTNKSSLHATALHIELH